jgi:hypothetical protein
VDCSDAIPALPIFRSNEILLDLDDLSYLRLIRYWHTCPTASTIPGFQVLAMLSFPLRRQDEPIRADAGRLPSARTEQLEWDRPWAFSLAKREPGGGSQETLVQAATLCMGSPWSASERSVIAAGSVCIPSPVRSIHSQIPHSNNLVEHTKSISTPRFVPDSQSDMVGVEVCLFMQCLIPISVRAFASPRFYPSPSYAIDPAASKYQSYSAAKTILCQTPVINRELMTAWST